MPTDRAGGRIEMLDGFNSAQNDFEGGRAEHVFGGTTMEVVFRDLVSKVS